jgi:hypothetical protein
MTIFTHIHFHKFIGIASEAVHPDRRRDDLAFYIPMALRALHLRQSYVSTMGEKDIVRLLGVGNPGNLFARFNVIGDKELLCLSLTQWFFMAFNARVQIGLPGVRAILSKKVTILATRLCLFLVDGVVVIDGLVLGGIEQLWENNPAN